MHVARGDVEPAPVDGAKHQGVGPRVQVRDRAAQDDSPRTQLGDAKLASMGIEPDAMRLLTEYHWPGNVRELENTIERAMVLSDGPHIEVAGLPERLREGRDRIRQTLQSGELSIKKTTRIIEEELIRKALQETGGNRTNAAKILEISHRALLYKIKEYEIDE